MQWIVVVLKPKLYNLQQAFNKEATSFQIGNYKSLYEGDDLLVGTHSVQQDGKDENIVLCLANKSEDGKNNYVASFES